MLLIKILRMKTYREIIAWQKAMDLVTDIYKNTEIFPDKEKYGLTNQMRRASVSIPSNIAEGFGRNSLQEFIRFLNIAKGSLFELQTQLEISLNLAFTSPEVHAALDQQIEEVGKLLNGLVKSLKNKLQN